MAGRTLCRGCGVATTDPWPTDAELEQAYADWYRPSEGRFSGPGDALLRRSRATLARRLADVAPPGRVLDVGAGDGVLLDALRASGREALGIERRSDRPDVVDAELAELEEGWAAVVFWHSLEHLPDPAGALREAARLLRPGGLLVVAVPNAASLQARVFGDRWLALDLPRHLTHIPARGALRAGSSRGARAGAGELRARRAGGVRLAARPGRPAARSPRPLRRDPPRAGSKPADVGVAAGGHAARGCAAARSGGGLRRGRDRAAAGRDRLRRGPPFTDG